MNSREDILGRVRAHLGRTTANAATATAAIAAALATPVQGPKPAVDASRRGLIARFCERSENMSSTVDRVADWLLVHVRYAGQSIVAAR